MVKLFVTLFARPTLLSYSKYFTEDADFLWATGKLSNGRSEIHQQVTNVFSMVAPEYKHISDMQKIRFLKPDIAIGDGTVIRKQTQLCMF